MYVASIIEEEKVVWVNYSYTIFTLVLIINKKDKKKRIKSERSNNVIILLLLYIFIIYKRLLNYMQLVYVVRLPLRRLIFFYLIIYVFGRKEYRWLQNNALLRRWLCRWCSIIYKFIKVTAIIIYPYTIYAIIK